MTRALIIALACAVVLAAPGAIGDARSARTADTVIGFDDVAAGTELTKYPVGADVGDVDFTVDANSHPGWRPLVTQVAPGLAQSGDRVVNITNCSTCEFPTPVLTGSFGKPHSQVSAYVGYGLNAFNAGTTARVVLTAYDKDTQAVVGSQSATVTAGAGFHTRLSLSSGAVNIGYFKIEAPDAADATKFIGIDDLTLDNPTAPPTPGFSLSAASPDVSLLQGGSSEDTITINRSNFTGDLTFSVTGLPSGVTPSVLPNPVTGTKAILKLTASNAAAPTDSHGVGFTVTARAPTPTPAPRTLSLHVFVQKTFSLALGGPSDIDLAQCSASIPVTVTRDLSFPGPVRLSAVGVPSSVSVAFDPRILDFHTGAPTQTSTLTLTPTPNAPAVPTTTIMVHATAGSLDQVASFTIHGSCPTYDVGIESIQVTQGAQALALRPRNPERPSAPVDYQAAFSPGSFADAARFVRGGITIARVFANAGIAPAGGVQNVDAELHAYRDDTGQELYESPLHPLRGPRTLVTGNDLLADEKNPDGAYTFTLPVEWTRQGSITLKAVLLPPRPQIECKTELCQVNNSYTLTHVPFFQTDPVYILPIAMTAQGIGELPPPGDVFARAINLTPVETGVSPTYAGWIDVTDIANLPQKPGETALALWNRKGAAALARLDDFDCDNAVGTSVFHVGVTFPQLGRSFTHAHYVGTCQLATLFRTTDPGYKKDAIVDYTRSIGTVAHEWFHVLGRKHAGRSDDEDCYKNEPDQKGESWPPDDRGRLLSIGLDRSAQIPGARGPYRVIFPGDYQYDLMSYCGSGAERSLWVSLHNWNALVEQYSPAARSLAAAGPVANQLGDAFAGPALRVTAVATSHSADVIEVEPVARGRTLPRTSSYRLVVRDGAGRTVSSTPMMEEAVADSRGTGTLEAIVPARGAASVEVVRDGRVLARRMRSEAPTLRILAPRAGARARSAGTFGVRWQTVDPDSRSLTATVAYSRDDGKAWRTLFVGPDRGTVPLPASYLGGSRRARLRIEISDGFNRTVAVSNRFTAAGSRPRVQITSPQKGTVIPAGSVLSLKGVAFDDALRPLTGKSLSWFAGRKLLGKGASLSTATLSAGRTTIRLVARDRAGRRGTATVVVKADAK